MAATSVFGGLVLKPEFIKTILRSEIMKESAVYQEILQEGLLGGKLKTIPFVGDRVIPQKSKYLQQ